MLLSLRIVITNEVDISGDWTLISDHKSQPPPGLVKIMSAVVLIDCSWPNMNCHAG